MLKNNQRLFATIIISIVGVCFIIILPIIVNNILFFNTGNETVIKNIGNAWVGYIGSYVSAIIGGLISGGLTLIGVLMTLNYSKRERYIESIPEKLSKIDEVTFYLGAEHNKYVPEEGLKAIEAINRLKHEIKDKYLALSAKVNLNTYKLVSELYEEIFDFVEEYIVSTDKNTFSVKYQDDQTTKQIKEFRIKLLNVVKSLRIEKEKLQEQLQQYI